MIQAFATLLLCQLAGESLVRASGLPVPGPVVGLVILALGLVAGRRVGLVARGSLGERPLGQAADGLLRHLSLLFVPAGVGIVGQAAAIRSSGLAIVAALLVSTVLTLVVSAAAFAGTMRLLGTGRDADAAGGRGR